MIKRLHLKDLVLHFPREQGVAIVSLDEPFDIVRVPRPSNRIFEMLDICIGEVDVELHGDAPLFSLFDQGNHFIRNWKVIEIRIAADGA